MLWDVTLGIALGSRMPLLQYPEVIEYIGLSQGDLLGTDAAQGPVNRKL